MREGEWINRELLYHHGYNAALLTCRLLLVDALIFQVLYYYINPFSPGEVLNCLLQIYYILIRQLLKELSDQGILYLPMHGP